MALSDEEIDRLEQIIAALGEVRHKLNQRSREFFDQTEQRYNEHGGNIRLSGPQWRWLESLMEQHG